MTYYAWSDIHLNDAEVDKESKVFLSRETVKVGEEVTESMFPHEGEFKKLIREGIIRDRPYPKVNLGESPKNALRRKARQAMEDAELGISDELAPTPVVEDTDQQGDEIAPQV